MNDNLNDIMDVVSDCTDVPVHDILHGNKRKATNARGIMCYLLKNAYPALRSNFIDMTRKHPDFFYKAAETASEKIENEPSFRILVNNIRNRLRLVSVKAGRRRPVSSTMTLFGFDYSDEDRYRRGIAIRNADMYMQRLCMTGRQPVEDGMVFTVAKPKNHRNWYKDTII